MFLTISPLGQIGFVADIEPTELALGAWTDVENQGVRQLVAPPRHSSASLTARPVTGCFAWIRKSGT
jgi:hypothetical protein